MARGLWAHRDFRFLWFGQSISELGSQVSVLALPLVAIDRLHAGVFLVGLLAALQTLPFLVIGLPAGAWVDRMRRRPVLIAADVGRMVAVGSVPVAAALGVLTLAQLFVVAVVGGVLTVFFDVAYQSYLPALIRPEELVEGNAKLASTMAGAQISGTAVGGLLVSAVGAAGAVAADAASYVVSFLSLAAIRSHEEKHEVAAERSLRREIGEGLRFVMREPLVRSVAGATATSNLFSAMSLAVLLVFLRRQIMLSPAEVGILLGVGSAGGLRGAAVARPAAARFGVGRAILVSIVVCGAGEIAYPLVTRASAGVLMIAGGVAVAAGSVAYNVNQLSMRQARCPLRLQGRMNATVRFLVWGTMPLGSFLGGVLGGTIGLRPTLWVGAVGSCLAAAWIVWSPVVALRTIEVAPL